MAAGAFLSSLRGVYYTIRGSCLIGCDALNMVNTMFLLSVHQKKRTKKNYINILSGTKKQITPHPRENSIHKRGNFLLLVSLRDHIGLITRIQNQLQHTAVE